MAADWNKLGDEFADSSSVVIGDADCTASGKEICGTQEVRGYPTIKYFKVGEEAQKYTGGRDFDALKAFTETELQKLCTVAAPADCSEKEAGFIAKNKDKSADDVAKALARLEGMKGNSMAAPLKNWLMARINILKQF
jgi:hypothetical protein